MFIGHYGVAFLLKKRFKEIPLWLLFTSVQFSDILAFTLVVIGIESIRYNPNENPFLRNVIEYVPISHSLIMNLIFSLIAFLLVWRIKSKQWGYVLACGVLSHWFIDFVVHTPDMPLFFNSFKVGLGLWQFAWASFALEFAVVALSGYYLYMDSKGNTFLLGLVLVMLASFSGLMLSEEPEIVRSSMKVRAGVILILYLVFTVLAYWSERRRRSEE